MNGRVIVAVLAAWMVWACSRGSPAGQAGQQPVRDIILVTIDTLRADAVGYTGNSRVRTPFLDALAARGIVFSNAHAHNVVTLPSHVNILTGLYPFQHGVHENAGFKLDPRIPTVASMLQQHGFATAAFVGAFPLDSRFGLSHGFDTYDDNYGKGQATVDFVVQERRAGAVLAGATKWWRAQAGRKRFLWIHLYDVHAPYAPPQPFLSQYAGHEYLGEVAYVDSELQSQLGPILREDARALIVVTADHGEALGDHGERTHGLFAYEPTLKIPLLLAGPGIAHRVERASVRHIDIAPTLLAAAGVRPSSRLPGLSLLGPLSGGDSYFESLSSSLNRGWAPLTGIVHGGLKCIDLPLPELYDLAADPGEASNLLGSRRREAEEARRLLGPMLAEAGAGRIKSEEAARLRSLGYLSGSATRKANYTAADDPKTLVALDGKIHDAIAAFESGHPGPALQTAREIVAARPEMAAGRTLLAFMLQQNERLPEAVGQLEMVVKGAGATDDDRVQLALLYAETGQPARAVALLRPRLSSDDPDILNAYGVALADDGQGEEAVRQFQRVLALDANNAPACQNLGIVALQRGDLQGAREWLGRALELNPRLPLALNALGVLQARSNEMSHAVTSWKQAVDIDPRQYDAWFNIGLVEGRAGHKEQARSALQRFIQTAPPQRYRADIASARLALASLQ